MFITALILSVSAAFIGQVCNANKKCAPGLICKNNKCEKQIVTINQHCNDNTTICGPGLDCWKIKNPIQVIPAGVCVPFVNVPDGLWCDQNHTCTSRGECLTGSLHASCQSIVGKPCNTTNKCKSGFTCWNQKCIPKRNVPGGFPCNRKHKCKKGDVCGHGKCLGLNNQCAYTSPCFNSSKLHTSLHGMGVIGLNDWPVVYGLGYSCSCGQICHQLVCIKAVPEGGACSLNQPCDQDMHLNLKCINGKCKTLGYLSRPPSGYFL